MRRDAVSSRSDRPERPSRTLEGAYRGFVAFGVLNLVAFRVMSMFAGPARGQYSALVATGLLVVVGGLAAWAYIGWGRPGFVAGLLGGYALMTLISGGTCTLFVNMTPMPQFNMISGFILYAAAVVIFGLARLNRHLSDSE